MKITVRQHDDASDVWVALTEDEAERVAQAPLSRLRDEPGYQGPGYHLHLDGGDGSELTIAVLDTE